MEHQSIGPIAAEKRHKSKADWQGPEFYLRGSRGRKANGMEPAHSSDEAKLVRRWRLGHGAVFLTMAMLALVVAAFVASNGCELMKPFAVTPSAETQIQPNSE